MSQNYDGWRSLAVPPNTETYFAVSNQKVYDLAVSAFASKSFNITPILFRYNAQIPFAENYGMFKIVKQVTESKHDLFPCMMIVNSGDKSRKVTIVLGAMHKYKDIFIPGHKAFVLRKHTKNVMDDLRDMVKQMVDVFEASFDTAVRFFELLSKRVPTHTEITTLVGLYSIAKYGSRRLLSGANITELIDFVDQDEMPLSHWDITEKVMQLILKCSPTAALNKILCLDEILQSLYFKKTVFELTPRFVFCMPNIITDGPQEPAFPAAVEAVESVPEPKQVPVESPQEVEIPETVEDDGW